MLKKIFIYLVKISKYFSREKLYYLLNNEAENLIKKNSSINILNIGSSGEIEKYIKIINKAEIISIDIDETRNPDIVMDATKMTFESNRFDAIFMMEVLEHIPEPQKAIDEIYRTLKKDGTLVLSTPYIFGLHDKPYDFYRYTKYGLSYLLKDFKNVKIVQRNDYIHTIIVLISRLMKADSKSDKIIGAILFILTLVIYPLLFLLSKIVKSNDITTGYFVVAKK